jgi:hypothetical protein
MKGGDIQNMWCKRNLIIIAIATVVIIAGVLGGVAIASANDENASENPAPMGPPSENFSELLDKVATVYQEKTGDMLDTQALIDSFTQVQEDIRSEALDNFLNKMVDDGKLTSDQAHQYKDWVNARPDVPVGPGIGEGFMGKFRGMMGPGGRFGGMFRGWCGPGGPNNNDNNVTDQ